MGAGRSGKQKQGDGVTEYITRQGITLRIYQDGTVALSKDAWVANYRDLRAAYLSVRPGRKTL